MSSQGLSGAHPPGAAQRTFTRYADGQWHRLHPATPLLRGGIALIAVLGVIVANLRERLVDFFFHTPSYGGDPIDQIYNRGLTGWALLGVAVVILVAIGGFYLSWRMHTFRIGDEAVEVRSGILSRSHRKARLDRIQGINVHRPVFARVFGAAKLEIVVAGHDANVHLAYLSSGLAEDLRRDILRLASGAQVAEAVPPPASAHDVAGQHRTVTDILSNRVDEFISPADLNPDAAPPASVVMMHPGRLAGSLLLSGFTVFLLIVAAAVTAGVLSGRYWILFVILPGLLGTLGYYTRRFGKALRYSISGTSDGVRIGFGLFATSSETLPPGRIHAVEVLQPVLWRPFGWWQIRINTAGHSHQRGAGESNSMTLPVGSVGDVHRVLPLLLPGLDDATRTAIATAGMNRHAEQSVFADAPRRARWLRPFSWRRTGYTIVDGVVVLRHGVIGRRIIFVPLARLQSVEVRQGPVRRWFALAKARVHTVEGHVHPELSVIAVDAALELFDRISSGAIAWAARDTSHRWNGPATSSGNEGRG
ncbi:PH domain-containing protein [Rathayibacter soli]|uniref:PH domain-containing protein n=1 Tax=Rathayibacter soli TaxID=3144168 RepID=UPI0027E3CDFD|nr:PH domain-containing protein [Glaciibacter superstes]